MAADSLLLEIVTPQRAVFSEPVREVALPGDLGEMDVLPGHLPLMTLIAGGEVTAITANGTRRFAIDGGFAELEGREISEGSATEQALREHREALAKTRARMRIVEHATKR